MDVCGFETNQNGIRRRLAPLFTLNEKIKDVRRFERKTTGEREKI